MPLEHRFFHAPVAEVADLAPSFRRFTFRGDDLADYGDPGYDQRWTPCRTAMTGRRPGGSFPTIDGRRFGPTRRGP